MSAQYHSRRYALINRWNPANFEIIRDWVKPVPGHRVLDIGCGKGHVVKALRELGVLAEGIDLNPAAAEVALVPQVKTMSATELDYPDDTFDSVVSFHAIEHIPEIDNALAEISRVVKPGGNVLLVYPAEPIRGLYAVPTAIILHRNPLKARQVHVHNLKPAVVASKLTNVGLEPVRSELRLLPSPEYATLAISPPSQS